MDSSMELMWNVVGAGDRPNFVTDHPSDAIKPRLP